MAAVVNLVPLQLRASVCAHCGGHFRPLLLCPSTSPWISRRITRLDVFLPLFTESNSCDQLELVEAP